MQSKMASGEVDINKQMDAAAKNPGMLKQMQQQQNASEQYMLSGATTLKEQGNKLIKTDPNQAAKLYIKAITNLTETGATSPTATALMKACRLNLALCHLNTDNSDKAVEVCTTVLGTHSSDTKALYRRGLAYEKLGKLPESLRDFQTSSKLSPGDVTVTEATGRLQALVDALPEEDREPEAAPAPPPAGAAAATPPAAANQMEMMKDNPAMVEAAEKMARENPEMVSKMQQMMMKSGVNPGAAGADPSSMKKVQEEMQKEMAANPGMAASMQNMMSSMGPEARAEMVKAQANMLNTNPAAAAQLSAQTGMDINPDQMKMAADMMSSMPPDAMEEMMKAAGPMMESMAKGQGGMGGAGPMGAGGMPDQAGMAKMAEEMTKNPKMMENMSKMMGSMDPEMLSSMAKQAGQEISPEQAKMVTEKMKGMSPEQMQTMMKWTQKLATLVAFLKRMFDLFFGSYAKAAVSTMLIAVFFGWLFGYGGGSGAPDQQELTPAEVLADLGLNLEDEVKVVGVDDAFVDDELQDFD
jgi:tetratricopeptide (TPR) repeat protein